MSTRDERFRAMDAAVFRTITDADWRAMFRRHRAGLSPNRLAADIRRSLAVMGVGEARKKILDLPTGISEPGSVGNNSTYL